MQSNLTIGLNRTVKLQWSFDNDRCQNSDGEENCLCPDHFSIPQHFARSISYRAIQYFKLKATCVLFLFHAILFKLIIKERKSYIHFVRNVKNFMLCKGSSLFWVWSSECFMSFCFVNQFARQCFSTTSVEVEFLFKLGSAPSLIARISRCKHECYKILLVKFT